MNRPFSLSRRRLLGTASAAAGSVALVGCAALVPGSVDVPKERLQEALGRRFPLVRRIADGIDFTIDTPRLSLIADSNRIAVECSVGGGERLFQRPLAGVLALSSGLVFDAADNSVRARDVRVERLQVEGLPPALERTLERLVRPLAAAWLEQQPIYALRPRDIERLRAANVAPGAIRVTASGITIALEPRAPGA